MNIEPAHYHDPPEPASQADPSEADAVDDEDGFFGDDHDAYDEARDMEMER